MIEPLLRITLEPRQSLQGCEVSVTTSPTRHERQRIILSNVLPRVNFSKTNRRVVLDAYGSFDLSKSIACWDPRTPNQKQKTSSSVTYGLFPVVWKSTVGSIRCEPATTTTNKNWTKFVVLVVPPFSPQKSLATLVFARPMHHHYQ